jgi:3-deoxy-D-manno-octulosonate 8-phosphate phosphatase (KDO 8-P phosphatase)
MFENIKAIAMDVDGVLTDGTFWWGTNGDEFKRFCYADVTGIPKGREAGIIYALVSGESSPASMLLVQRYADKLKIADVYKGCHDKAAAVRDFARKHDLQLSEICFIGDDIPDLPAMEIVGLAIAPANAQPAAKAKAHFVTSQNGGFGVIREIIEAILEERKSVLKRVA